MRLLIYVQHLRGIGHLRRVSNIIRCLIGHIHQHNIYYTALLSTKIQLLIRSIQNDGFNTPLCIYIMRLLIYVQHLRGIGHLRRVSNIINCLNGHKITVLSGGLPFDQDLPNHVDIVRLPAVYAADTHGTSICLTTYSHTIRPFRLTTTHTLTYSHTHHILTYNTQPAS